VLRAIAEIEAGIRSLQNQHPKETRDPMFRVFARRDCPTQLELRRCESLPRWVNRTSGMHREQITGALRPLITADAVRQIKVRSKPHTHLQLGRIIQQYKSSDRAPRPRPTMFPDQR